MKLFETKKNMKETQNMKETKNNEEHSINDAEQPNYENENNDKPAFISKSDYGWDGDY